MKQSIRAFGWTITISMLIIFAFLVTAVYSMFQTILIGQGISLGAPEARVINGTIILSMPLTINNTGYYDITKLNLTTIIKDSNGTTIAKASTSIERIPKGLAVTRWHDILNPADILSNIAYLLFNDTMFVANFSIGLRYANALAFRLTMANNSFPWGAPFYNFTSTGTSPPYSNGTHLLADVFLGFENHSPFGFNGTLYLNIYNEYAESIGSGSQMIDVSPSSRFDAPINVVIEKPADYTGRGYVEVAFDVLMLGHIELGRLPYG